MLHKSAQVFFRPINQFSYFTSNTVYYRYTNLNKSR